MSTDYPSSLSATPLRSLVEHPVTSTSDRPEIAEAFSFQEVARLTAALKRGDEAAFAWLHNEWSARINRYCFALASADENFARDISQAAWLRLIKHVRVMHDEQALWSWIACAARHAATDLRRTKSRYFQALSRFAHWWRSPTHDTDADEAILSALDAAVSRLSDEERTLLEARYFADESLETIGARHDLSARAVEGRLARLRTRLRAIITEKLKSDVE